ncbi:Acetyltransferase, GNAT family protein [Sulfitobacter noctilucicola]|uniref:GNAT superfamily N-acetyltransferase n=1 Tax=Sulfitobacter noctilucicola TaxID=1342301 RepID=A0A7W6MAT4_9RHOB|nr:GNAT family N-acetyltransferase [Sulfitobacter noctilucicola]KIN64006.1 Acetyltransferase, GNAT family protein [Sulfitobacter noctilucicola]MBB4175362.1 GNAT superfamily N-acetyltransferase [Sulfitobacter noctilucicola]
MDNISIRRFGPEDRDWLVREHRDHYARAEGFDEGFGVLVAGIIDDYLADHDPECEAGWIACQGDKRLGSIFCVKLDNETAKLRLFLLTEDARGQGLGKQLLSTCMGFAKSCGFKSMTLWTHESHRAAGALYAKTGWSLISSKPVKSFGQDLVEQHWQITL